MRHGAVQFHRQCRLRRGGQRNLPVDARRPAASVSLRNPTDTVKRVRPAAQHQFLQVTDPCQVPSCDALKILRRNRRTSSSTERHEIASQSRSPSCSPFTAMVSNLPASTEVSAVLSSKTHLAHVSTPVTGTADLPISGQLYEPTTGRAVLPTRVPVAFRPPALACWAILFPPRSSAFLTVGPPDMSGPGRGFHVPHAQDPAGVGAASAPGRRCSRDRANAPDRRLPLLNGQPCTPMLHPSVGAHPDEAFPAVHSRSPVRPSPRLRYLDGTDSARAFPRASHPAVAGSARRGGDGT